MTTAEAKRAAPRTATRMLSSMFFRAEERCARKPHSSGNRWQNWSIWPEHRLGADPGVELIRLEVTERHRRLLEGRSLLVGLLGDLRRLVVADMRVERGHQHQ